jgi:CRISPR-associated endonuclease Csn1
MTKNILGLDLGTTSIGWAFIKEKQDDLAFSAIEKIGVRVNPLTTDEQTNFEKGKPVSVNADRTLKRSARRNLHRYKLRRENLIEALKVAKIISDESVLTETGKNTTHTTYQLRAKAVTQKIEKEELARVFFAINKKRGYKSSRKTKNEDEGQAIDGMSVAKRLYEENLTPGQLAYQLLKDGKKYIPDFYRSDLQAEFDKVWNCQQKFYPEIFINEFYKELQGKGQRATSASFWGKYKFNTAENKGTREEKKLKAYEWRSKAVSEKLEKDEAAYVITEINNNLHNSSGYLGAISDRSKELFFNKQTIGQYLYKQLQENPHTRLKNQVFYRQDYLDEFEAIWNYQKQFHSGLTDELKTEIRDIIIFYQRKLKSQKNLISFCEFESKEIEVEKNGQKTKRTIGLKVVPKSSPLFQEFKIWQVLHNLVVRNKINKTERPLEQEEKEFLFDELNLKGNLKAAKIIELLALNSKKDELNYTEIEGNRTNKNLYEAFLKILEIEGYDEDLLKLSNKDEINVSELGTSAFEIKEMVKSIFETLNINTAILDFDAELDGKAFEQQASYQIWHLLHSYEGDNSNSGNEKLYELLEKKFGFKKEHALVLVNVSLSDDYGNLSAKAIRKIYPFIKENKYSIACELANYRHSAASLTKEEIKNRELKPQLELLKKNSLRNPVVEKILNQMVNVVNTLSDSENKKLNAQGLPEDFHFDEIRIELARELKKNAKERAEMTTNINAAKLLHEKIIKVLQDEFGVKNPTRSDIIRYKLYEELKNNGYKDIYTNTYIPIEILFSKQIDIDHIIPQSRLFDDSFSNKTVIYRQTNLDKGNQTACDYIESKFGAEKLQEYKDRVEMLYKQKEGAINKAKYQKLLKKISEIGEGFIERDLRDSQYIARKAKDMLYEITRSVVSTTGEITNRLREDWNLVNVMQELNFDKFKKLGLTEQVEKKDGTFKERIVDWSKRNDHRHHAMDALTIAFTKRSFIQYLNHLNARKNEADKFHATIHGIEEKETYIITDDEGNRKRVFKEPIPNFRQVAKEHLENILVSHKAKNKVVTKNKNKIKTAKGNKTKKELTPRGQLHKETVYGKIKIPVISEEKIGTKFNEATINCVANLKFKSLLLQRLKENGNDPKKAFSGKNALAKNPIYLDEAKTETLPEKIKLVHYEDDYTIRKDVTPDLKIDKVIDAGVRRILQERLKEFGGNAKEAFSNLDKNPIWLNKEKGVSIKRVRISGVKNAEALHYKKDHFGKEILDDNGNRVPVDFVSTGNNHHVAIYRDVDGNLQENVISFYEAVERVNQGIPVIDKTFNVHSGWKFLFTMKQNEYFVFPNEQTGFNPNEINLLDKKNYKLISLNLFRVQKLATKNYMFRHHLETNVEEKKQLVSIAYRLIQSTGHLKSIVKVRINHIGEIVKVGEY